MALEGVKTELATYEYNGDFYYVITAVLVLDKQGRIAQQEFPPQLPSCISHLSFNVIAVPEEEDTKENHTPTSGDYLTRFPSGAPVTDVLNMSLTEDNNTYELLRPHRIEKKMFAEYHAGEI